MKKKQNSTITLIEQFRNKAGAWQSQDKVPTLFKQLEKILTPIEYNKLSIAYSHYTIGEGAEELYGVCKELKLTYETIN